MAASKREKLKADLSAYLDGELPEERAREVERQLAESEQSRQMLEQLREVSNLLGDLPRHGAPGELSAAMRRRAERHELLDVARRPGSARILKLFGRVSAAAAVVAACVLVGWQVLERGGPPETERTAVDDVVVAKGARPHAAERADRRVAAKMDEDRLASLGHVGAELSEEAAKATPRPAKGELSVAMAEPPAAMVPPVAADRLAEITEAEEASAALVGAAGTMPGAGMADAAWEMHAEDADTVAASRRAEPTVKVRIAPQNAEQYAAAYAALSGRGGARGAPPIGDLNGEQMYHRAAAAKETRVEAGRVEYAWAAPVSEVRAVIFDLKQEAPEQVHVTMTASGADIELLARLLQPAEPTGVVFRAPQVDPSAAAARGRGVGAARQPIVAYRRAPGQVPVDKSEPAEAKEGKQVAANERDEAAGTPVGPPVTTERRLSEEVKKRLRERGLVAGRKDEERAASRPGRESDQPVSESGRAGLRPAAAPADDLISFRVTLLPPAADQPATQPATQPTQP